MSKDRDRAAVWLMVKEAVSEYIWLAICKSKIYKINPPLQGTRLSSSPSPKSKVPKSRPKGLGLDIVERQV